VSIRKIINQSNTTARTLGLSETEEKIKIEDAENNLRKMSPNKSLEQIKADFDNEMQRADQKRMILKDEGNYHQWRRVNLSLREI
jgi:hypothetical protein